jgi:hypothetical protein
MLTDEDLYQLRKHEGDIDVAGAAADEILELRRQLEDREACIHASERAIDDLNVQCRFWRQCAEHAVAGWNKLEDEHEAMKDTLRELARALGMTPIVDDAPEAG